MDLTPNQIKTAQKIENHSQPFVETSSILMGSTNKGLKIIEKIIKLLCTKHAQVCFSYYSLNNEV